MHIKLFFRSIILILNIFIIGMLLTPSIVKAEGRLYKEGLKRGTTISARKWKSYKGDCGKADGFLVAMKEATIEVEEKIMNGEYNSDPNGYGKGFLDGMQKTMTKIATKCHDACMEVGKFSAEISAGIYCAVSIATNKPATFGGMLRKQNLICGEAYTIGCESAAFSSILKEKSECAKFTTGPEWEQYFIKGTEMGGACAYTGDSNGSTPTTVSIDDEIKTLNGEDDNDLENIEKGMTESPISIEDINTMSEAEELGINSEGGIKFSQPISICCFVSNKSALDNDVWVRTLEGEEEFGQGINDQHFSNANMKGGLLAQLDKRIKDYERLSEQSSDVQRKILIVGYTDERASDTFNMELGIARAKMISSIICSGSHLIGSQLCGGEQTIRPVLMSCGRSGLQDAPKNEEERRLRRKVDVYYPGIAMLGNKDKQLCVER